MAYIPGTGRAPTLPEQDAADALCQLFADILDRRGKLEAAATGGCARARHRLNDLDTALAGAKLKGIKQIRNFVYREAEAATRQVQVDAIVDALRSAVVFENRKRVPGLQFTAITNDTLEWVFKSCETNLVEFQGAFDSFGARNARTKMGERGMAIAILSELGYGCETTIRDALKVPLYGG